MRSESDSVCLTKSINEKARISTTLKTHYEIDSGLSSATKGEKIVANLETKLHTPKLVATTEIGNISVFPI